MDPCTFVAPPDAPYHVGSCEKPRCIHYTPEAILDALDDRPEVQVDFCRPPTLAALVDALDSARRDGRPADPAPPSHAALLNQAWEATEAG
jgi:hypothetical protein